MRIKKATFRYEPLYAVYRGTVQISPWFDTRSKARNYIKTLKSMKEPRQ